jgi:hypothetical protein
MPPISLPIAPIFENPGERIVWETLMAQLPEDGIILSNLRILEYEQEYEIDFVVAVPELGVSVIEVKGGHITPNDDSTFTQGDRSGSRSIDPLSQVMKNKNELKRFLAAKSSVQHFDSRPAIIFPHGEIPSTYSRPNLPRSIISDHVDLSNLVSRLENDLRNYHYRPSALELRAIVQALGRNVSTHHTIIEDGHKRDLQVTELTEQQFKVLDLCKAMPRFAVLGAAGCGKTFVAIEQGRRKSRAGAKVLFLCYNRGLAEYLTRQFQTFPESDRPFLVSTFHSLDSKFKWTIDSNVSKTQDYWDSGYSKFISEKLSSTPIEDKFDVVIIDEAQDFLPNWWETVLCLLRDPDKGNIFAFGDIRQGIFGHATDIPVTPAALNLDINMRNSVPIGEIAALCLEDEVHMAGLGGPPVQYVECDQNESVAAADKCVQDLLTEGWKKSDICVLTTSSKHPSHLQRAPWRNSSEYWDSYFLEDEVFYGTVFGFKGLERRVIVLAMNGWKIEEAKKDLLYTAITRARDLLIICGSPEDLRQSGGKELLKKLKNKDM